MRLRKRLLSLAATALMIAASAAVIEYEMRPASRPEAGPLAEHVASCEACSDPERGAKACPKASEIIGRLRVQNGMPADGLWKTPTLQAFAPVF